eukprot:TRINITY_DN5070_c0_g1_i1.p1 TRINITY_DN5070_c0_g1~~TRINITY_DN5070_c0_g1_i1.p1  ORF type:complete len:787 (+),score=152.85 TRINITY_DN5070_c0_g1_i1:64-2424(+)
MDGSFLDARSLPLSLQDFDPRTAFFTAVFHLAFLFVGFLLYYNVLLLRPYLTPLFWAFLTSALLSPIKKVLVETILAAFQSEKDVVHERDLDCSDSDGGNPRQKQKQKQRHGSTLTHKLSQEKDAETETDKEKDSTFQSLSRSRRRNSHSGSKSKSNLNTSQAQTQSQTQSQTHDLSQGHVQEPTIDSRSDGCCDDSGKGQEQATVTMSSYRLLIRKVSIAIALVFSSSMLWFYMLSRGDSVQMASIQDMIDRQEIERERSILAVQAGTGTSGLLYHIYLQLLRSRGVHQHQKSTLHQSRGNLKPRKVSQGTLFFNTLVAFTVLHVIYLNMHTDDYAQAAFFVGIPILAWHAIVSVWRQIFLGQKIASAYDSAINVLNERTSQRNRAEWIDYLVTRALIVVVIILLVLGSIFFSVVMFEEGSAAVQIARQQVSSWGVPNITFDDRVVNDTIASIDSAIQNYAGSPEIYEVYKFLVAAVEQMRSRKSAPQLQNNLPQVADLLRNPWSIATLITDQERLASLREEVQFLVFHTMNIQSSMWNTLNSFLTFLKTSALIFFRSFLTLSSNIFVVVVAGMVYLSALLYLLDGDDPVGFISKLIPGSPEMQRHTESALRQAIQGIFIVTFKIAAFHSLVTWNLCNLFDAPFVYIPTAAASMLAVLGYSYTNGLLVSLQVFLVRGGWISILPGAIHVVISMVVDQALYYEIPSAHPFIVGISIFTGLYNFGLQGVIIGPILVCLVVITYDLYSSFLRIYGTVHRVKKPRSKSSTRSTKEDSQEPSANDESLSA